MLPEYQVGRTCKFRTWKPRAWTKKRRWTLHYLAEKNHQGKTGLVLPLWIVRRDREDGRTCGHTRHSTSAIKPNWGRRRSRWSQDVLSDTRAARTGKVGRRGSADSGEDWWLKSESKASATRLCSSFATAIELRAMKNWKVSLFLKRQGIFPIRCRVSPITLR